MANGDLRKKEKIDIGGIEFKWDTENGIFSYGGGEAVLFWITSAMKTFFDTIEEVSGEEAAEVVLQVTGFRQGLVVSDYFKQSGLSILEVAESLPITYASAGWGSIQVNDMNEYNKTANIQIKDSWENKINLEQGKTVPGQFIPGHFAGLLAGLFECNMEYRILRSQIQGDEVCEFEFFLTEKSMEQNIHALTRRKEVEAIQELEAMVEDRTRDLHDLVKEISSPIIPVLEDIVVVPLLGKYDEARSKELIEKTLTNLPLYKARYLVLDLTGLDKEVSEYTMDFIGKLGAGASLIGTETILVGISPELGMLMASSPMNLGEFNCFRSLQHGILFALSQQGKQIV